MLLVFYVFSVLFVSSLRSSLFCLFLLPPRPPPSSTLFPYTTLFRSRFAPAAAIAATRAPLRDDEVLRLSSSKIDDYLTCPLKYRYAHEVQVPLSRDPLFMYGNAAHAAIRHYYKARLLGHPVDVGEVVTVFEQAWSSEGFL